MFIGSLSVQNFRNHTDTAVELSPSVNFFIGDNAQGKTNLLEAIFLTCVGRGWRTRKDREMIKFDSDTARVKATATKSYGDAEVEIALDRHNKKSISINKIPVQKMGELMGQINCIFFSPDELRLIKEAPADRRRFLDIDISQLDKVYFYSLLRYSKILAQRNSLLKTTTEDILRGLDIWDEELAKEGARIIKKRLDFIKLIRANIGDVHRFLTNGKEEIDISYEGLIDVSDDLELTEIETILRERIRIARDKDLQLRTTSIGPHRDDLKIQLDGKDVRTYASQGQQRTVALSLKLAELGIFEKLVGERPILLLDDVLSELDDGRQSRLLEFIKGGQAILTTTGSQSSQNKMFHVEHFGVTTDIRFFVIENGSIKGNYGSDESAQTSTP